VVARSVGSPTSPSARSAASKASPASGDLAEEAREHHVVEERESAERSRDLKRATDPEIDDPVRRLPGDLAPLEANRARVRRERTGEHVEDRALAGSVRADQAEDLALLDRERHAVDGREATEALGEALDG